MPTTEISVEEIVQNIKDEISPDGKTIHCGGNIYSEHFSRITQALDRDWETIQLLY